MKSPISLNIHSVLDYLAGFFFLVCPAAFGFSDILTARNTFYALGGGLILYSLVTNYRYSVAKWVPLGVHMGLDVTAGIVIFLAPWLFGYRDFLSSGQIALHFVLGVGILALVGFTRPRSERERISSGVETDLEIGRAA